MIFLTRTDFFEDGIFGNLYNDDKTLYLSTLEHAFPVIPDGGSVGTTWSPIVQPGQYTCVLGAHQLDHGGPQSLYCIEGVVDAKGNSHSGICFHKGNFNRDTEACVLLGMGRLLGPKGDMITLSDQAFLLFMAYMNGVPSFQLTVQGG